MNTTVISGRLVRNPGYNEVENEKGLHKIAKFVLAVRRNYSDEVSFIPVKAFAKKAEFARDYLMQGTKVMVEGEIVTGNYEDKDTGKKIYTTEVYANRIEFAGAKMVDRPPFPEDAEGFLEIPEGMYVCNKEARNYYLSELMMCFNFVFNEMCHGTGSAANCDFDVEE